MTDRTRLHLAPPDSLTRLAKRIFALERKVHVLSTQPQLGSSGFNGTIVEYDQDGNIVSQTGLQDDGTHGSVTLGGPTPPTPSAPTLTPVEDGLLVQWDGTFTNAVVAPLDFSRVSIYVDTAAGFTATPAQLRATVESPQGGGALVVPLAIVPQHVKFICWSTAGKPSASSVESTATPTPPPMPWKDDFTVTDATDRAYALTYLPTDKSVNFSLNGLELEEGQDYTVDLAAGVLTLDAGVVTTVDATDPDVLTANYWTSGATPPPPPGILLTDYFVGPAGTVDGRIPDIGNPWSVIDGGVVLDGAGNARPAAWGPRDNGAYAAAVSDCTVADVQVEATIDSFGSWAGDGGQLMLIFRCISTDEWMGLEVPPAGSGRTTNLNRNTYNGGAYQDHSAGDFGVVPWAAGDKVTLKVVGTVATLYRNDIAVGRTDFASSLTDIYGESGFTTATKHGIGAHAGYANFTMGWRDIVVRDPEADPTFSIADTFDRADSAVAIGAASDGGAWVVHGGVHGISGNRAYLASSAGGSPINMGAVGGGAYCSALRDIGCLLSQDVTYHVVKTSGSPFAGIWIAFDPTTVSGYLLRYQGWDSNAHIMRIDHGTPPGSIFDTVDQSSVPFAHNPWPTPTKIRVLMERFGGEGVHPTFTVWQDDVLLGSWAESSALSYLPLGSWVGHGAVADLSSGTDYWHDMIATGS